MEPLQESRESNVVEVAARRRADAARASGAWSTSDDEALEKTFEEAAEAALSVPSIAERALFARRVARRIVPTAARPALGRLARRLDMLLRRLAR